MSYRLYLDAPTMPQPEPYVGNAANLFDESGRLTNEKSRALLTKFLTAFEKWVERHARSSQRKEAAS